MLTITQPIKKRKKPPKSNSRFSSLLRKPGILLHPHSLDYLYGINPVLAALHANRRKFDKLYLSITEKGKTRKSEKLAKIEDLASKRKLEIKYLHKVKPLADIASGETRETGAN